MLVPPGGLAPPARENPGSATGNCAFFEDYKDKIVTLKAGWTDLLIFPKLSNFCSIRLVR